MWTKYLNSYITELSDWDRGIVRHPLDGKSIQRTQLDPDVNHEGEIIGWQGVIRGAAILVIND